VDKEGAGNWTLSGSGNYTGSTTINSGVLVATTLAAGGTNSSIGAATASQANLVINGGTLQYTGGTVSTNRNFTLGTSGGTLDASGSGALTLSNTTAFTLAGTNTARTLTLAGTSTAANTFAMPVGDNGSGATSVDKEGAGNWTLTGANTFTGTATVNDGTLKLNATGNGAMGDVGSVVINSGGTLLLGAANQINGSSTAGAGVMTLNGGKFATGGFGQGSGMLGTLTLSATSAIDLGAGASVVHFGVSSGQAWTGELVVLNWNGTIGGSGGGTDQLFFGTSTAGLTSSQVDQVVFEDPNGVAGNYSAEILSTGEVVAFKPIPEAGTYAAGAVLVGLAGWWEWWRRRVLGCVRWV
jgi:fibronectin-binding autotransporter adhesin